MKRNKGFTLIELIIVVAIIGILFAAALSQYKIYVSKSKIGDVFFTVGGARALLQNEYAILGVMPADNTNTQVSLMEAAILSSKYVGTVVYTKLGDDKAKVDVVFQGVSGSVNGKTATFIFTANSGIFNQSCSSTIEQKFFSVDLCKGT